MRYRRAQTAVLLGVIGCLLFAAVAGGAQHRRGVAVCFTNVGLGGQVPKAKGSMDCSDKAKRQRVKVCLEKRSDGNWSTLRCESDSRSGPGKTHAAAKGRHCHAVTHAVTYRAVARSIWVQKGETKKHRRKVTTDPLKWYVDCHR